MVAGKLRKTASGTSRAAGAASQPDSTRILWIIFSVIGMLPLILLAVVALIVLVVLLSLTGSTSVSSSGPSDGGTQESVVQSVADASGGDGTGTFDPTRVADSDTADTIEDAAGECDLLTPVILAAQIRYASHFDATTQGGEGRAGLSQLTPDVFATYGKDDDGNGSVSALDMKDDIHAHARYFCHLADEVRELIDKEAVLGDELTLTLMAWEIGIESVETQGGMVMVDPSAYPFQVRQLFADYTTTAPATTTAAPDEKKPDAETTPVLSEAQFEEIFPGRDDLYTYAGLTDAMAAFPGFAATGDEQTRGREMAAFLGNVDHESGGLVHTDEIDRGAWGNYCDAGRSYGCPAGPTAYHGRGPIQLTWNYNYRAAGDALGLDLLNHPDLVTTDASVAWQTALWYWMTQTGAGATTPHAAITGGEGFGATVRIINGMECDGGKPAPVRSRADAYRRIAAVLGSDPGDDSTLTC